MINDVDVGTTRWMERKVVEQLQREVVMRRRPVSETLRTLLESLFGLLLAVVYNLCTGLHSNDAN